jgi:hypothetical protein
VRQRPAEIDFDLFDLAVAKDHDFGVAKAPAVRIRGDIGDEHRLAVEVRHMDEFEIAEPFAVRPAAREIGLAVKPVVERASEMEVKR